MSKKWKHVCPRCSSKKTVKYGSQGKSSKYFCKGCERYFSVYHGVNPDNLWIPHIDGVPFRKLGNEHGISGKQMFVKVERELTQLPDNTWLTKEVCDSSRWSRILVVDGKFVKVKGFNTKTPFIWGLDYLTHDIPAVILARSENTTAFSQLFGKLQAVDYTPRVVVCDDRSSLGTALSQVFPYAKIQSCHNHYLENIRQLLHTRTDATHQHFFNSLKLHVFTEPKTKADVYAALKAVQDKHAQVDTLRKTILLDIHHRIDELFTYLETPSCPNNTNLIELYNSHLNGRLKTIKGFSSAQSAGTWLNAYTIRRRTKELTDCDDMFKYLNKHASIELTIKKQAKWPEQLTTLGISKPNYFEKSD